MALGEATAGTQKRKAASRIMKIGTVESLIQLEKMVDAAKQILQPSVQRIYGHLTNILGALDLLAPYKIPKITLEGWTIQELISAEAQLKVLQTFGANLEQQSKLEREEVESWKTAHAQLKAEADAATARADRLAVEVVMLNGTIDKMRMIQAEAEAAGAGGNAGGMLEKQIALEKELAARDAKIDSLKRNVVAQEEALYMLGQEKEKVDRSLNLAKEKIENLKEQLLVAREQIKARPALDAEAMQKKMDKLKAKNAKLKENQNKHEVRVEAMKAQIQALLKERADLTEQVKSLVMKSSYGVQDKGGGS
ncbi:hypothetical protein CYMTET_29451 [Cymbomonas tetramitiformis]|uniref:Uncharacterized protein n=1 Tax=Cymbomonas tetramitiformis TaxID=36881 RepID=A0AAE0FL26_9CHLO|nr:hypothetical protein CYMTET_29451 [Cymbomonas tetramitiformis]